MSGTHLSLRCAVTAVVAAGLATGSGGVHTPEALAAAPPACAATFNLFIPGTWETDEVADPARPVGMLGPIAETIQREQGGNAAIYFTPYMARAFDNSHTYADSKATAIANAQQALRDYLGRCPEARFTLTGYSQGADATGDLASAIGNDRGPVPADRVLAVGLLADPGAGTPGEDVIGPRPPGTGIADPRPLGMGALSGRVSSICHPEDLYCAIQKGDNPLLGLLGSILSTTLSGAPGTPGDAPDEQLAAALTSDFSAADLPGIPAAIGDLSTGLGAPDGIDLTRVRTGADLLARTLGPLAELIDSGATGPAALHRLAAAPGGTPEHDASSILDAAGRSDLPGALSAAETVTSTVDALLGNGIQRLPSNSPDALALATAADDLTAAIATLTAVPADILRSAAGVLAQLEPRMLVDQTLALVTRLAALHFPGILQNLALLPQRLAALDGAGVREVAAALGTQLQPLADLADTVDLNWISQVLTTVPDEQGYTSTIASATSALADLETALLADDPEAIQEITWPDLDELLGALTGLTAFEGTDLITLVNDGLSAASFFASGAHVSYGTLVVDDTGRDALRWLGDWLNQRIGSSE
ncbi:cutinase family protein [Nocardia crassostreae]|uniref:cutinase family protein n=1 Tax=Nocardia crassostreae TaxID=53428 RepID=UPI0008295C11|nr:cutinase family protein [Nocardia crassostreae]